MSNEGCASFGRKTPAPNIDVEADTEGHIGTACVLTAGISRVSLCAYEGVAIRAACPGAVGT